MAPGSISEKILVKALEKMNVIHRVLDEKEKLWKSIFVGKTDLCTSLSVDDNNCCFFFAAASSRLCTGGGLSLAQLASKVNDTVAAPAPVAEPSQASDVAEASQTATDDGTVDAHGWPWSADLHASTKGMTKMVCGA